MRKALYLSIACVASFIAGCSSSSPILQWESSGGPYAPDIRSLLADQEYPQSLYAGLSTGTVVMSSDKGTTWTTWGVITKSTMIHRLVQHPLMRDRIYATTDSGLYVSSDRGRDWQRISIEKDVAIPVTTLCIDPFKTDVMYIGTRGSGIYKSSDGGVKWTASNTGVDTRRSAATTVNDLKIEPLRPDVLYAAMTGIGLVRSTDQGEHWTVVTEGVIYAGSEITAIVLHPKEVGVLCIGTDDGSIYRSSNGGMSWAMCRAGRGKDGIVSLNEHPSDLGIIYAGTGSGALISPDFGASWRVVSPDLPHTKQSIVISAEKRRPALYSYGRGVGLRYSQDNGLTWLQSSIPLSGSPVPLIVTDRDGKNVYAVSGSAVFAYLRQSRSWQFAGNGLICDTVSSIVIDADSTSILYAGSSNGLFRTSDDGSQWQTLGAAMRFIPIDFFDIHPLIRTRMFASSERGFQVSTNTGSTWTSTKPLKATYRLRSLTFSPRNAGRVYGATLNSGVIASSDGGLTWKRAGFWQGDSSIEAVTVDPHDQQTVYAWTRGGHGFRSTDGGNLWKVYATPWNPGDSVHIAFDRRAPSDVIALVNNRRLFYSAVGGETWREIPVGPVPDEVLSLCWNQAASTLYAGMTQSGVYQLSIERNR